MFKSWKFKLFFPLFLFCLGIAAKYFFFEYPVSKGKVTGLLSSIKKEGAVLESFKVVLEHANAKVRTKTFSVSSKELAKELELFVGKEIEIQYEQNYLHLFRPSSYFVVHWSPLNMSAATKSAGLINADGMHNQPEHDHDHSLGEFSVEKAQLVDKMEVTLFCSTLGSLYQDKELYDKVKNHLKETNIYIYQQIDRCNQ